MSRWEPGARDRLEQAALELYLERGYEQTTVAEIARRAGLTERTFFRHFADKREVLFGGTERLRDLLVGTLVGAPPELDPVESVDAALAAVGAAVEERRERSRRRHRVIAANPVLQERELIKLAGWAGDLAEALRERGAGEPRASLLAHTGVAVFRVAYERWIADGNERSLTALLAESLAELRTELATGPPAGSGSGSDEGMS